MGKTIGIYCIENKINHKKYIGQSVNIPERWKRHIRSLNKNTHHNNFLQEDWNLYGIENFDFFVLETCDRSDLDRLERKYISSLKTTNEEYGYNLTSGGITHYSPTEYVREKIGETSKGRKHSMETKNRMSKAHKGENNHFYGKHHTEEAKKRMKEKHFDVSGSNNPRFNPEPVICIDTGIIYSSAYEASKELNLYSNSIRKCCQNKLKTTGGLRFKFYEYAN